MLLSSALILDNMAVLLAGSLVVVALTGQYLLFDYRMRQVVASISVERTPARNPVRKGTAFRVATTFTAAGTPRLEVRVEDLLPQNASLIDGSTRIMLSQEPGISTYNCSYQVIPLAHGTQEFSGISVTL
ncbi:MAG: hypothetical protein GYA23_03825, partial [Methanomicrobiales archaeon]|nr:hypothetical protein [Methanomicrobiales archaeon]